MEQGVTDGPRYPQAKAGPGRGGGAIGQEALRAHMSAAMHPGFPGEAQAEEGGGNGRDEGEDAGALHCAMVAGPLLLPPLPMAEPYQELEQQPLPAVAAAAPVAEPKKRERPAAGLRAPRLADVLLCARVLKEAEAARWLTLCMHDGMRVRPRAVGFRKDPADPSGQASVCTPLYPARAVFERVVDPALQRASKWKRWQRLWKASAGQDGPLAHHAVFVQEDGRCASEGGARQEALLGLSGLEALIDAAASDKLTQRPRDFFFFDPVAEQALPVTVGGPDGQASESLPERGQGGTQLPSPAISAEELMRQATELLSAGIEQGSSQTAIQRMIDELRLPPDRAAVLREIASLLVQARMSQPTIGMHLDAGALNSEPALV